MLLDGASLPSAIRKDKPLLVIDTCSLLDVLRDPTRPETERDRGRLVRSLADELENRLVNGLIVHQTSLELAGHEEEVKTVAKAGIDRMASTERLPEGRPDAPHAFSSAFSPSIST